MACGRGIFWVVGVAYFGLWEGHTLGGGRGIFWVVGGAYFGLWEGHICVVGGAYFEFRVWSGIFRLWKEAFSVFLVLTLIG